MSFPFNIRTRINPQFPAVVSAAIPLKVTKTGLSYAFSFSWDGLENLPSPIPADYQIIVQAADGTYSTVTLSNLPVGMAASVPWAGITDKPTTLDGYAITDATPSLRAVNTTAPLTGGGDFTANRTLSIAANGIDNALLAQMATARFKGRATAGTGDAEDLTATQATAILNTLVGDSGSGGTKGLAPAAPAGSAASNHFLSADGSFKATPATALLTAYIAGLALSNNATDATNDIDVAAGKARSSLDTTDIALAASITKRLDAAWAVGTGNGGRMSAAAIADTTYHVFLIRRSDTGVVDVGFDVSPTAPTMPTNYDSFRRIGSILRESGAIAGFLQDGDTFFRASPVLDVNATAPGTSAVSRTLSTPAGIKTTAMMAVGGTNNSASWQGLISSLDVADIAPTASIYNCAIINGSSITGVFNTVHARTDTSRQVRSRLSASGASVVLTIETLGWIDRRAP